MSERRFRRTPGGVCSLGLQSPSYFAASVGYVWELTVRRYIEHHWDAVA
jgi:REP element-mobilizing transposase RayT